MVISPPPRIPIQFGGFAQGVGLIDRIRHIKGPKQIAVVKHLVEQFESERNRVPAGDLLIAAYGSRAAAKGKRVANIFSGNLVWEDYIEHDDDGE